MPDILHKVAIKATPAQAYAALATIDGLSTWWTTDTSGSSAVGGEIGFRFGEHGFNGVKVIELEPEQRVLWEVIEGPESWLGTRIGFDLSQDGDDVAVLFKHSGWREQNEFMHTCTTKWAMFLMSLKAALETGIGAPYPNDVHITHRGY
ncbi:SRPBCC domain-containing protein [Sphingomonas sp.]|uniref:SRPBCC family protein n=1 Tax=Sphingomonas sp. TaxID=28214 RepID=UPI0031DCFD89